MKSNNKELHHCTINSPSKMHGDAVNGCVENENGELWVNNGEYASQVNFCPKCGYEAKVKYIPTYEER